MLINWNLIFFFSQKLIHLLILKYMTLSNITFFEYPKLSLAFVFLLGYVLIYFENLSIITKICLLFWKLLTKLLKKSNVIIPKHSSATILLITFLLL